MNWLVTFGDWQVGVKAESFFEALRAGLDTFEAGHEMQVHYAHPLPVGTPDYMQVRLTVEQVLE